MSNEVRKDKFILMCVFGAIETDARVIRAAEALNDLGENILVISYNSDLKYSNRKFYSIVFNGKKSRISLISFWIKVIVYCIKSIKHIKLIYLHDYYLCGIGNLLSKLVRVKWVYDSHELLINRKKYKKSLRGKLFAFLESINVKGADLVVTANYERERILRKVYKLRNTIYVLNIKPIDNSISSISNLYKEDYIVYQGYLSKGRDLEDFIKLLEYLPKNIKIKIIGGGPDLEYYKDLVVKLNLNDRIVFTGKVPYSQLVNENKDCIIGIVSYSLNGLNNYYCSPNKLYEYAQLNMPMIFSSQPFLVKISRKYRIGEVFYENMSYERRSEIILEMIDNLGYYQKNMNMFLNDYSFDNEMSKLKNAIKDLLNNNSN